MNFPANDNFSVNYRLFYSIVVALCCCSYLAKCQASGGDSRGEKIVLAPMPDDVSYAIELSTEGPPQLAYYSEQDYANCTDCQIPAGIYFRISQTGIDYITGLAAQALPQLLDNSTLPDVDAGGVKVLGIKIETFEQPIIRAHFIEAKGVGGEVYLPHVLLSAVYDISSFIASARGKMRADIHNLSISMEVHLKRDPLTKMNIITTPVCNVTSSKVNLVFVGDWSSAALNAVRTKLDEIVVQVLATQLCQIPVTVAHFFEEQKRAILMTTPAPSPTTPEVHVLKFGESHGSLIAQARTTAEPAENENAFYETSEEEPDDDLAAKFAADLCAADRIDEYEATEAPQQISPSRGRRAADVSAGQKFASKLADASWAPDLTLMYPPTFSSKDVVFGLDGGIVCFGEKAKSVPRPRLLDVSKLGEKMFGLLISEYVPNTFLTHVYDNGYGTIYEVFKSHSLPKFIKPIAKVLCRNCELQLLANLTKKPQMKIDDSGVNLEIEGDVSIKFVGRWKTYNLVNAGTTLDIVVKPYVRHSRVYGDVGLTKIDIKMKGMGLRGLFANSLKKAINAVVPKKLWPKIKKRLRFALSQRGIRLPVMCGVELERPSLEYTQHGIVINTDFSYDLPRFVRKFRAYIKAEIEKAKKKQSSDSGEDESDEDA